MAGGTTEPAEVFVAYAHADEHHRQELEKHLALAKRLGLIADVWHDRKIMAGTHWEGDIDQHLNSADLILLLISADFMASDYCYEKEMKRALQREAAGEAIVIPVMVRPCDWKGAQFDHLQGLPTDFKAIVLWDPIDLGYTNVAQGIRDAVERHQQGLIAHPVPIAPTGAAPEPLVPPPSASVQSEEERDNEIYIRRAPLAERRVIEFFEGYDRSRASGAVVEDLFRHVGALRETKERRSLAGFGFALLLNKGPFVERSRWTSYDPQEFARAAESRLLRGLEDRLQKASGASASPVLPGPARWTSLAAAADELILQLERKELTPSLVVVTGGLGTNIYSDLHLLQRTQGDLPNDLRHLPLLGVHRELPVLHIHEAAVPALYVVDLAGFANVWIYVGEPDRQIQEIDEERALELLRKQPTLVGEVLDQDEAMRKLMLKVLLQLWEYAWFDGANVPAVEVRRLPTGRDDFIPK